MGLLTTREGQPSYALEVDNVSVFVTVQGGHLTATFRQKGGEVSPFFVSPWWQEAIPEGLPECLTVLRGDFFCLPFGANEEPYQGEAHPPHGKTANACWDLVSLDRREGNAELTLSMDLDPNHGSVEKKISLSAGEPLIYQNHIMHDYNGKSPLGYHPILQFPDRPGAGIIDISQPVTGFTAPVPVENPANRGYSLLQPNTEITGRSKVPCIDGTYIDLTRYPVPKGYEDIVIFINDASKTFTYTAASFPEEGYLYFQLKDPKVLSETMFWLSNGGRHYPPWNGRVNSVLGMEEITAFFHYGLKASVEANFFQEKGFKSCLQMDGNNSTEIKLIMGVVSVEKGFEGVRDIVKKNESAVTILGKRGEEIDVPCRVDFLT